MRISDWSSDVCSSDLRDLAGEHRRGQVVHHGRRPGGRAEQAGLQPSAGPGSRLGGLPGPPDPAVAAAGAAVSLRLLEGAGPRVRPRQGRSEAHTSELPSLMRISYSLYSLKTNKQQ